MYHGPESTSPLCKEDCTALRRTGSVSVQGPRPTLGCTSSYKVRARTVHVARMHTCNEYVCT